MARFRIASAFSFEWRKSAEWSRIGSHFSIFTRRQKPRGN
jgi:hypothetical protein